jgi:hypothetical protein
VRARLATDGREADGDRALLAGLEEICHAEILESIGSLIVAMSASALGVDDTLWDAFTVEM